MEQQKKHIVFVHLLNNYTGSPKVLMQLILGFVDKGYEIDLITSSTEGFLSNINGINYKYLKYKWDKNKFITFFYFIQSQFKLFLIILSQYRNSDIILYINTLLPFGAAIAGKITKKKVIYHVHEFFFIKSILNRIYLYFFSTYADKVIFVSEYLKNNYKTNKKSIVIYNTLDYEFLSDVNNNLKHNFQKKETILMICSIRKYKGIYQFINLSKLLPNYLFELVLSSSEKEVNIFCIKNQIPKNLKIYSTQINIHPFYQRAKILLNLSLTNLCIESFGLSILEAMSYGIPSIVPPVGGPIELVEDGSNGFLVDSRDLEKLKKKVEILLNDKTLYQEYSKKALLKSKEFSNNRMIDEVEKFINKT